MGAGWQQRDLQLGDGHAGRQARAEQALAVVPARCNTSLQATPPAHPPTHLLLHVQQLHDGGLASQCSEHVQLSAHMPGQLPFPLQVADLQGQQFTGLPVTGTVHLRVSHRKNAWVTGREGKAYIQFRADRLHHVALQSSSQTCSPQQMCHVRPPPPPHIGQCRGSGLQTWLAATEAGLVLRAAAEAAAKAAVWSAASTCAMHACMISVRDGEQAVAPARPRLSASGRNAKRQPNGACLRPPCCAQAVAGRRWEQAMGLDQCWPTPMPPLRCARRRCGRRD